MRDLFLNLKKIGAILGFHLIFYGPRFIFLDIFFTITTLLSLLFVFFLFIKNLHIPTVVYNFLGLFCISISYTFIIAFRYDFYNTSLLLDYFKIFIFLFSALFLIHQFRKRADLDKWLNTRIYYATVINAIIVIITAFSPAIKKSILPLMSFKLASSWDVLSGLRSTDWSLGGGTLLSMIFVMMYVVGKYYKDLLKFQLEGNLLLFIASFLTARTGFYLIVFIELALLIVRYRKIFLTFKKTTSFKRAQLVRILIYPVIFLISAIYLNSLIDMTILTERVLPWALESIYKYQESDRIETQTTSILLNDFYFLPNSLTETLFGKLDSVENTDVGYIKYIHYIGFLGLFLLIIPFVYLMGFAVKNFKSIPSSKFLALYLVLIFLVNFKELFLLNSRTGFLLLMIWFTATAYQRKFYKGSHSPYQPF